MKQKTPKYAAAFFLSLACVGTLAVGVSSVARAAEEQKTPKVSKAAAKPLKAAQEAMEKKDYQAALTALKPLDTMSGLTPDDTYLMNEMYGFSYLKTGDLTQAAKYLEANLSSPFMDQQTAQTRVKALFTVNYQVKNYDKAIEFGNRAIKENFADEDVEPFVVQAYYLKGDYQGSLKTGNELLDRMQKAGKTPTEQQINLVVSSCVKLKDEACTTRALERMVQYYPKPEYWSNIVYTLLQSPETGQGKAVLNVYRLASEVDALQRGDDYTEMAQLAIEQGSPGEAVRALEKGFAKGVFKDQREKERNQRLLESAKKQAATDQATLAKSEKDATPAKTGDRDVGLGLAYLSYEQYPKAIEAFSRGLAKGGVRNEPEARLLLGIAQLKSGAKADATKTFEQVKGNQTLERLANLWTLHANQAPAQTAQVDKP